MEEYINWLTSYQKSGICFTNFDRVDDFDNLKRLAKLEGLFDKVLGFANEVFANKSANDINFYCHYNEISFIVGRTIDHNGTAIYYAINLPEYKKCSGEIKNKMVDLNSLINKPPILNLKK